MTWRSQRVNGKAAPHHPMRSLPRYVPGEVIVEFRGQLPAGAQERIARSVDGQVRHLIPGLNQQVVTLSSSADPLDASQRLSASPGVIAAEPNWIYEPLEVIPNDPAFDDQ